MTTKVLKATLLLSLFLQSPISVQAQEDFPQPPDFDEPEAPPPPPPPAKGGAALSVPGPSRQAEEPDEKQEGKPLGKRAQSKFIKSGIEDITNENFPETIESFDFNGDITDVIKTVSELTGKNFIIDPGVRGKITIIAPSKITVAEAYKAFLSALAINGFTVVPSGSFLKVKSARNAQRDSIETYSGAYYPNADQMITRIIHLKHISAEAVNRDLRILTSKDGEMSIYTQTNSLIISDWGANIDRVMRIIAQLDVPGFEEQLEVVQIKYGKAKDLADLVDKIVNKGQSSSRNNMAAGGFAAGVPRLSRPGGTSSQQGGSYFMAIPEEHTNSIIIVGNKSGIIRVKKLIAQLDFRVKSEDGGGVNVYYMKHGDAEKIAQVLSGVAKDSAPKTPTNPNQPGGFFPPPLAPAEGGGSVFSGEVKITADKNTNSLVITASKQDYELVMNLLRKLDIARDQVFVEAIIMEMASGDGFQFKPTYYKFEGDGGIGRTGFNGGQKAEEVVNPLGGIGAVLGFAEGNGVEVNIPIPGAASGSSGTKTKVPSLVGLISLLKRTTKANVLSQPQVIALDNQEALIQVGDKVVVGADTVTSATGGTTTSPKFEEALIELKIKPFINPTSETVRMEIDQSVKQPSNSSSTPKAFQDSTLQLSTRKIKTNIVVRNKDTIVLGGLIKDRDNEEINKVPLLGDLPLIGWLFKSKETNKEKVNMLVFITPKIIRSPDDQKQILNKKVDERIGYIKGQGGVDPFGSNIDKIMQKAESAPENSETEIKPE